MRKTYEIINISALLEVPEIGGFPKGYGIEDYGNFSEGACFKLNLQTYKAEVYVVCCKDKVTNF